ncbi:alpha-isopropylmalate synthase regulatory domain-containing protein [Psychromonas sp. MME1]|uniref:alpha-isopropylmalate synthase regulatory domain-containing protein n=1 Tax=Psychromonas sp. MME1 TaxID=3231032 RepID=UPI0034E2AF08
MIRINSQSGKGGVAYVLDLDYGIQMPRWMQVDFSPHVQLHAENSESEVSATTIYTIFNDTYLAAQSIATINNYQLNRQDNQDILNAEITSIDAAITLQGEGKGVLDAFVKGVSKSINTDVVLIDYSEHALPSKEGAENEQAEAMAYVQLSIQGQRYCAAAKCDDIVTASLQAVLNAVNRSGIRICQHKNVKSAAL